MSKTLKSYVQSALAVLLICTYCYLVIIGQADIAGFGALVMYVIKKYLDGIDRENGGAK